MAFKNCKRGGQVPALNDEQIRAEEKFLEGVPRVNVGALLIPPIWGPAHGIWVAILYYPLWLVADNCFVNAVVARTPLAIALAVIAAALLVGMTVAFSVISQPFALHRAVRQGMSKGAYLRHQRAWAIAGVIVGVVAITAATYYNLCLNPRILALG